MTLLREEGCAAAQIAKPLNGIRDQTRLSLSEKRLPPRVGCKVKMVIAVVSLSAGRSTRRTKFPLPPS